MTDELVTIVLPTYNGAKYLAESIESCLNLDHRNLELIIVDDASTDKTPEIIAEFKRKDNRIQSIRLDKNKKLPGALNTGFLASRGKYLTWTSDDNLYEPEAISIMLEHLRANPSVGLVYCDLQQIDDDGAQIEPWLLDGHEVFPHQGSIGACFLYRREVYEQVGDYCDDMFMVEDLEFFIRVSKKFKLEHLPKVMPYKYRRHTSSLTSRFTQKQRHQIKRARCKHIYDEPERTQILRNSFLEYSQWMQNQGDFSEARNQLKCCLQETGPSLQIYSRYLKLLLSGILGRTKIRQLG